MERCKTLKRDVLRCSSYEDCNHLTVHRCAFGSKNCRVLTAAEMSMLIFWAATPCGFVGQSIPPHSSMLNVESEYPVLLFLYRYQQRPDSASDVWQKEHFQFLKPEQAQSLEIGPPWLVFNGLTQSSRVDTTKYWQGYERRHQSLWTCGTCTVGRGSPVPAQRVSRPRRWTSLLHVWQSFWTAPRARGVTYVRYSQCQAVSLSISHLRLQRKARLMRSPFRLFAPP